MYERFGSDGLPIEGETTWDASPDDEIDHSVGLQAPGVAVRRVSTRPRSEPPNPIPHWAPPE